MGLPEADALSCLIRMTEVAERVRAGRALAHHVGAEDLILFVPDPEIGLPLPAPGFPQTLPAGQQWGTFLAKCREGQLRRGELLPPGGTKPAMVTGLATEDGTVLALIGGQPQADRLAPVIRLLPLLGATLRTERKLLLAESQTHTARRAVAEATTLAAALDDARHQLQEALVKVEDALRVRDEFLSIASHELKTPLTGLLLQTQMLQRFTRRMGDKGAMSERISAMADTMERQVKRLSRLTYDLLDISRIASGRLELTPEAMDLRELVEEVTGRFGDEAAIRGCDIFLHNKSPIIGHWDRLRLDQVVTNLLSNAIKYGEGRPIDVSTVRDRDRARLVVQDHGVGIAPADRERIFERFERIRPAGDPGGLGLGLYITRQIVDLHGGAIHVESVPGHGSAFTIDLPLVAAGTAG